MKVVVSGYYGFKNAGDEALLDAIVAELSSRGHLPVVLSATPSETESRFAPGQIKCVDRKNLWKVIGAIRSSKILLSGGGTLLQDKTSSRSLTYYLLIIRMAKMLGRKVVVFNQSLGPLSVAGEVAVKKALGKSKIILRDRPSLAYAERLGLNGSLGADCAMVLPAPEVVRNENLVILVPREGTPVSNKILLEAAKKIQGAGREVLVLGVQPGHDEVALEAFSAYKTMIEWEPQKVYSLLAGAGYVLSVRLHGAILAAATGTPFAGIAYDPKVRGFCQDAGAVCIEESDNFEEAVECCLLQIQPNWSAIIEMKQRAFSSFDSALEQ